MYVVVCAMVMLMAAVVMVTVGGVGNDGDGDEYGNVDSDDGNASLPSLCPHSDPLCTLHLQLKISIAFCWVHLLQRARRPRAMSCHRPRT